MAQPGDGSKALEKSAEEGPVVTAEQHPLAQSNSSSTITPGAHKEKDGEQPSGVQVNGPLDPDHLFAHLPEHEKQILKKQLDSPEVKASFATLYRYASKWDIVIMIVAAICSIAAGAALPLFTVCSSPLLPPGETSDK